MDLFKLLTPITYWILIILWSFILYFYLKKIWNGKTKALIHTLLLILSVDAFRTLFESMFFGVWYTSLAGLIPLYLSEFLMRPEIVIVPKVINLIAAVIVIFLLLRKWLPQEEDEINKLQLEIKKSEQYNRTLFDESPIGLALASLDGKLVDVNKAYANIIGRSIDETKKLTYMEITPEKYAEFEKQKRISLKNKGAYGPYEKEYIHKNGYLIPVRVQGVLIEQDGEKFIWSSIEDITDKVKTEKELIESGRDLNDSQSYAKLGSWRLDVETNEVRWTEELYKMYGFDSTIPPPPYTEHMKLFTPESWEKLSTSLEKTSTEGTPYNLELETVREDGTSGWMWVHGEAIKDSSGKIVQLKGAAQDITERKKVEIHLRESEERYKALHNASFGGIAVHDMGVILECNKGLSEITGYTYEELIGMNGLLLISEDTRDKVIANINSGYEKPYEAKGIRKNGTEYPMRLEARNIPYKGKNVRSVEFRDLTKEKETEQIVIRSSKLESLGTLAGGIAHDFNNLLSGIYGNIELAKYKAEDGEIEKFLTRSIDSIERAKNLTSQLITFAKGGEPLKKVEQLEGFLIEIAEFSLSGSSVIGHYNIDSNLRPCLIDRNQIAQVLDNIIINAVQAMPDGGAIYLSAENVEFSENYRNDLGNGKFVKITIRDEGTGISKDKINKVFDPFFTTKAKGHGIGLSTSYSIIKKHDGLIEVDSEIEKGATFTIYLPSFNEKISKTKIKKNTTHKGSGQFIILDDDPSIRSIFEEMLTEFGYSVVCFSTGEEVMQYLKEEIKTGRRVAGMIFDLTIPGGMGGKETVTEVRQIDKNTPVFVFSGYSDNPIMAKPEQYGFTGSLVKPFKMSKIIDMLNTYIDS